MEIINPYLRSDNPQFSLFDFDGTISLIREGWQNIMIPMMIEIIGATQTDETPQSIAETVSRFVSELTGRQTIYQMIRLAEEVRKRGVEPETPLIYKKCFQDRLNAHIATRITGLEKGTIPPERLLVPGCLEFLNALKTHGLTLYLASGTDLKDVERELQLLGISGFFGDHVYGALDNYRDFSKEKIVRQIIRDSGGSGSDLIGFGDGYVETQCIKNVGGFAVGVASNEANPNGAIDESKRSTLINSGADIIIPDFQDSGALLNFIFG